MSFLRQVACPSIFSLNIHPSYPEVVLLSFFTLLWPVLFQTTQSPCSLSFRGWGSFSRSSKAFSSSFMWVLVNRLVVHA